MKLLLLIKVLDVGTKSLAGGLTESISAMRTNGVPIQCRRRHERIQHVLLSDFLVFY